MIAVLLLVTMRLPAAVSTDPEVTFENANYCAVRGSSVKLGCSFSYPPGEVFKSAAWYKGCLQEGQWTRVALSLLPSYENRTEYLGDQLNNCKLAIHNLQDEDTGHYYFRFDTDTYGRRSKGSVHLSITELKAAVHPQVVTAGRNVTLDCQTSCRYPDTTWLKDGRRIKKKQTESFLAQAEDAGKYVCAAAEQVSEPVILHVQYSPLNVCAEASPSRVLAVGTSVNLTCSSVANPAVERYTWFRVVSSASSMDHIGSGQVLSLPSVEASHAGQYLCQAANAVGENKSEVLLLVVDNQDTGNSVIIFHIGLGIKVVMVVLLTLFIIWLWRRRDYSKQKEENAYENWAGVIDLVPRDTWCPHEPDE